MDLKYGDIILVAQLSPSKQRQSGYFWESTNLLLTWLYQGTQDGYLVKLSLKSPPKTVEQTSEDGGQQTAKNNI